MLTQLFQPEPNLLMGLRFAKELTELGHEVRVMTGFPNYPTGRLYPGYRTRLWQREQMEGIEVLRLPVYPSHDRSALRRALCYGSLALSMMVLGPFLAKRSEVVVVGAGPMTLCLPGILLSWIWGIPFILDVQDLWPESVTDSGMLGGKWVHRALSWYCSCAYRCASHIIVLSDGYKSLLARRGAEPAKVSVVYNWCDPAYEQATCAKGASDPFNLSGTFNVVYAGNLGELQGLDSVIYAARLLQGKLPSARIVFVGHGTQEAYLKELTARLGLGNLIFLPYLPLERLPEVLQFAGALLVHLKHAPLSAVGIPQKVQAYLASGLPVLCAVEGEAARLVEASGGGVVCPSESPESLAQAITTLSRLLPEERQEMGRKGRDFYMRNLAFAIGSRRMAELFERAMAKPPVVRRAPARI